jgi:hypothetical protein
MMRKKLKIMMKIKLEMMMMNEYGDVEILSEEASILIPLADC